MMYLDLFGSELRNQRPSSGQTLGSNHNNYIRSVLDHNIEQAKQYYGSRSFTIHGDNLLLKILDQVSIHIQTDDAIFLDFVQRQADYFARNVGITSGIHFGTIHHDKFFDGSETVVFSIQQRVSLTELETSWRTYPCLRFYRLPWEHMGVFLPISGTYPDCPGLSVVGIDIPTLLMKYRFYLRDAVKNKTTIQRGVFLTRYVYPMSLEEIADHMFLNRIIRSVLGQEESYVEPNGKLPSQRAFGRSSIHLEVMAVGAIIKNHHNTRYEELLEKIPLLYAKNALELLALPEVAVTTQSRLLLFMSRLDYLPVLMELTKGSTVNNSHHNDWKRLCQQLLRDNLLTKLESLSPTLYKATKEKINVVLSY